MHMILRRSLVATMALAVAGCVAIPEHRGMATPAPRFEPIAFFLGATHGQGMMRIKRAPEHAVRVDGTGHMDGDTLIVDQHVTETGRPPHDRQWRLTPAGDGVWTGTLTDAVGPVSVAATGNTLAIRYHMHGGLAVRQWIYLQPGGLVALNRMAVFKLGMPVARLAETIRRVG